MSDLEPKDPKDEAGEQADSSKKAVDLSDLKSFSFGTQWTEAKSSDGGGRSRSSKGAPRREEGSGARSGSGFRKDRRPARPPRSSASQDGAGKREFSGSSGQDRGLDRGRVQDRRGDRAQWRGPREEAPPAAFHRPYESDVFDVCFYPEDNCFAAIIKAMRASHLTYELFHVAKLFMEKPDRFVASVTLKAVGDEKPERVQVCSVDGMAFATEEEVFNHALAHHIEALFDVEEVEVDPPSGNFPSVMRCPFTKVLLGPPNYHKYEEALREHHQSRLPRMSFDKLQSSMESVREEEVVAQWLESQKKLLRYTTKVAEGEESKSFDSLRDAAYHLKTELRDKVLRQVNFARIPGNLLEKHPESEVFKAMDGERERQLRFPLVTANAIRGRMRREKFSIYKKGAKGVTYVCAKKRNFRTPGQIMSPDLERIIRFLESHQYAQSKDLASKYKAWLTQIGHEEAFDEKKLQRDLHWLIADGYVSHFENGTLFAQPELEPSAQGNAGSRTKPPVASEPPPAGHAAEPALGQGETAVAAVPSSPTDKAEVQDKPASASAPESAPTPAAEEKPVEPIVEPLDSEAAEVSEQLAPEDPSGQVDPEPSEPKPGIAEAEAEASAPADASKRAVDAVPAASSSDPLPQEDPPCGEAPAEEPSGEAKPAPMSSESKEG